MIEGISWLASKNELFKRSPTQLLLTFLWKDDEQIRYSAAESSEG